MPTTIGKCCLLSAFVLTSALALANGCMQLIDGWRPMPAEHRAASTRAQIVLVAYVNRTFKSERYMQNAADAKHYIAEVVVLDVLKDNLDFVKTQRVLNVSNFGRRQDCYSDVRPNRVYVLFVTFVKNRLWAVYDDIYGAAEEYSRELEGRLQRSLGLTDWSPWSPCSVKCGGGRQFRERRCVTCGNWSELQTRQCNSFGCSTPYQLLSNRSIEIGVRTPEALSLSLNETILRSQARLTNVTVMMTLVLAPELRTAVPGVHLFTIEDAKARPKLAFVLRDDSVHVWVARGRPNASSSAHASRDERLVLPLALFDNRSHALTITLGGGQLVVYVDALYSIRLPLASQLALPLPKKNLDRWRVNVGQLAFDSPLGRPQTLDGSRSTPSARRSRRRLAVPSHTLAMITNVVITTASPNASAYVSLPLSTQSSRRPVTVARRSSPAPRTSSPTPDALNGFNWLHTEPKPLRTVPQMSTERPRLRPLLSESFLVVEHSWCAASPPPGNSFRQLDSHTASAAQSVCRNGASCVIVDRLAYFQAMCLCPPAYFGLYCHLPLRDDHVTADSSANATVPR